MKERTRKPWRDRMRSIPKALLCAVLALTLSVAPAGPALAQAQRLEAPVRTAAAQAASGVVVKGDGVTIDGAFISKEAFLDAISRAKRAAYPQADPAEPASQRAPLAPSGAPAGAAAPLEGPVRPASYGEVVGGPTAFASSATIERGTGVQTATAVAKIVRTWIENLWGKAMETVTYQTLAPFVKGTAWALSIGGATYLFAFNDAGELLLLLAGGTVCSIAPCWLSIAVAQHASDHAGDPIESEGGGVAAFSQAALDARDAEVDRIRTLSEKEIHDRTMVVAGFNKRTGQVAVGVKIAESPRTHCAEDLVVDQLMKAGAALEDIVMTPPIRPRTKEIKPVCKECQKKYTRDNFLPGTPFE